MKKILIDTNSINGKRSALIDGEKLLDFDLEFQNNNFQKGSIHKGKITKIEASLEAILKSCHLIILIQVKQDLKGLR